MVGTHRQIAPELPVFEFRLRYSSSVPWSLYLKNKMLRITFGFNNGLFHINISRVCHNHFLTITNLDAIKPVPIINPL
ncbi:hypothetical protein SG26_01460 [Haloarcula sp. CBA1115]|nr:hypothetical protein SG26_01460 [Haloarcula sp. CBA1115]KZX46734.1 hypothetical protein AV929_19825 [Haloarcula sp. K1]